MAQTAQTAQTADGAETAQEAAATIASALAAPPRAQDPVDDTDRKEIDRLAALSFAG